ncbi:MAG: FkbM family methyltransferase [Alphaproteobacteria bacterium]
MRRRPSFARILGGGVAMVGRGVTRLFGSRIGVRAAGHAAASLAPVVTVATARGDLRFWCLSEIGAKRASAALRQEPDTLAWLDQYLGKGEHLWDVGANIGVYGLYACLRDEVSVTCFEPMASTFAILARNATLNGFSERIVPLHLALSDTTGIFPMHLSSVESGSSMHALVKPENVRGAFDAEAVQLVPAGRGDMLVAQFGVRPPQHLKVDVDGHEAQVLEGMGMLLDNVRTVWIEMTAYGEATGENTRIRDILSAHGLVERAFAPAQHSRNKLFVNSRKPG